MKATLYTSTGCTYCAKIKQFLQERGVPYEERDILVEPAWLDELAKYGIFGVPALFLGGDPIVGYRPKKMAEILDKLQAGEGAGAAAAVQPEPPEPLRPEAATPEPVAEPVSEDEIFVKDADRDQTWDIIIIGAGPAGASSALYTARGGHKTLVLDKAPTTGALAIAKEVENYPGVTGMSGAELLRTMQSHAKSFGAVFLQTSVLKANLRGEIKEIDTSLGTYRARAVIISAGARARKGKIPGEQELEGRGVSYCALCDAAFTRSREIVVYGDNAEALEEVSLLSTFAAKIRLLLPGEKLHGVEGEPNLPENVTLFPRHKIKEILADEKGGLKGIRVATAEGEQEWEVGGLFLYTGGASPGTSFLGDEVPLDPEGYLVVDEALSTPVEGVFAAGDVRKTLVKQAVLAAADGALAAINADRFLRGRKKLVSQY